MADPATLSVLAIGSSAGGGILSAFGALGQSKAQSEMYTYQAGIAQFNKKIAEQNRDWAYATGEEQAGSYGMKARQTAGQIKATQSASNLDVTKGSATDVQESQHTVAGIDMSTIRNNAARTAYGYSVEAAGQEAQSQLYGMAAKNVKKAGAINAFSSILSGASSVSSKWLQASQAGVFGNSGGAGLLTDPNMR